MSYQTARRNFLNAEGQPISHVDSLLGHLLEIVSQTPFCPRWTALKEHYVNIIDKAVINTALLTQIVNDLDVGRAQALECGNAFNKFRKQRKKNGFRVQSRWDFDEYEKLSSQAFKAWKQLIPNLRKRMIVTCALIEKDEQVMAAQRSANMSHPLRWEFPGGKTIGTEPAAQCLRRELMEELDIKVKVKSELLVVNYSYPDFDICLIPFLCELKSRHINVKEHKQIGWFTAGSLTNVKWSEADVEVVEIYRRFCVGQRR